jgi:hypothetical protein
LHLFFVFCIVSFSIIQFGCRTGGGETENSAGQVITLPPVNPEGGPPAGNPAGTTPVPSEADLEDVSNPDHILLSMAVGLFSLSGGGRTRILYMNTCDADQVWTTPHCQNQDHPRLTVQNITFANGNSTGEIDYDGGGAIWVRGGRFKAVNCRFLNNVCSDTGPDISGAAVRVFSQYEGLPVYIVNCTFDGIAMHSDTPIAVTDSIIESNS